MMWSYVIIYWTTDTYWAMLIVYQGDWAISEIQFEYEKVKCYDLLNGSMELVFQKIQKWDI